MQATLRLQHRASYSEYLAVERPSQHRHDGSIICGKPEHPPHDGQATTNPVVVLEVLSPSSEGDDRGDKRLDFQSLASLQAYVIASQDRRRLEVYRRADAGEWLSRPDVYVEGASSRCRPRTRSSASTRAIAASSTWRCTRRSESRRRWSS